MSAADAWQAGLAIATATIYLIGLPAFWRERRRRQAADRMTSGALLARQEAEQRLARYETALDEGDVRRAGTWPRPSGAPTRLVPRDDELAVARAFGVVADEPPPPGRHRADLEDTVRLPRWRPPN